MINDRMYVLQQFINKKKAKVYLEIGVHEGECFLRIKARRKMAVDPNMLISPSKKRKYLFRNLSNGFNRYFEMTSDEFFVRNRTALERSGLDVVFIDGLHTYRQSLLDVQNALQYLNEGGVIVMHDCNPASEAAAFPADSCEQAKSLNIPGFTGEWNGDVWKTIVHLRSTRKDLNVAVLDCDQGLGVITKKNPESVLHYSGEAIRSLTYHDLERDRQALLNLKGMEHFPVVLEAVCSNHIKQETL